MHTRTQGFSLIELMTTLVIASSLTLTALPSFLALKQKIRSQTHVSKVQSFIQLGRNHALTYGKPVTICHLENNRCDNNWQLGMTAFFDSGTRNQLDGDDKIIKVFEAFPTQDIAYYNRKAIRFKIDGFASGTNGTFRYCPDTNTSPHSRAVIVNQAGRVRFSTAKKIECKS
ncbi:prepilin-type N-terminal cleavage/methylation domain-containing protein [Shewanella sp. WXL01]|uniref:Type II secretion system protein H n=1 Tax=Shewanella maritima TaxID=2520507 RepID=A0A411PKB9_9GAMM|nr:MULTISPECIES: GspH/FimT family pseudopilin [Shewanella]NKF51003.1 prepilin-type N-terminal cleavage/methylation domain-containing protein [Shewanella sp. WXL01]QBF83964.1 prepilin-type N-terminal cleavage/methylation domain-containing protein [Shewanella maritima]